MKLTSLFKITVAVLVLAAVWYPASTVYAQAEPSGDNVAPIKECLVLEKSERKEYYAKSDDGICLRVVEYDSCDQNKLREQFKYFFDNESECEAKIILNESGLTRFAGFLDRNIRLVKNFFLAPPDEVEVLNTTLEYQGTWWPWFINVFALVSLVAVGWKALGVVKNVLAGLWDYYILVKGEKRRKRQHKEKLAKKKQLGKHQ